MCRLNRFSQISKAFRHIASTPHRRTAHGYLYTASLPHRLRRLMMSRPPGTALIGKKATMTNRATDPKEFGAEKMKSSSLMLWRGYQFLLHLVSHRSVGRARSSRRLAVGNTHGWLSKMFELWLGEGVTPRSWPYFITRGVARFAWQKMRGL